RQQDAKDHNAEPIDRELRTQDEHPPHQLGRFRDLFDKRPPLRARQVRRDKRQPKREKHLLEVTPAPVPALQENQLDQQPNTADQQRSKQQRQPEVVEVAKDAQPDVSTQQVQRPVRQVDHVHQSKDQRQPRGHHKQQHAGDEPVQQLDKYGFH